MTKVGTSQAGKIKLWAAAAATALLATAMLAPVGAGAHHLAQAGLALESVAEVASGWMHSCARTNEGYVYCWGNNATGQLADGTIATARPVVKRIFGVEDATQVSAGADHTCALTGSNDVYCWGGNLNGQLGTDASLAVAEPRPQLVEVEHLGRRIKFTSVSAGNAHTCALSVDGEAWCWGDNSEGQLGRNGAPSSGHWPVYSVDMGRARTVVAGASHSCAIAESGELWCWGNNEDGRLGNGTLTNSPKPVRVSDANGFPAGGVTEVSLGTYHTCAATASKAVYCWGSNSFGRIGNPAGNSSMVPIKVAGHPAIQENAVDFRAERVSAGLEHTCAWNDSDGMAWCWGRGIFGQLGDGLPSSSQTLPRWRVRPSTVLAEPIGGFQQIAAGYNHTCARAAGDLAYCWGMNSLGQLGDSTFVNHKDPALVLNLMDPM